MTIPVASSTAPTSPIDPASSGTPGIAPGDPLSPTPCASGQSTGDANFMALLQGLTAGQPPAPAAAAATAPAADAGALAAVAATVEPAFTLVTPGADPPARPPDDAPGGMPDGHSLQADGKDLPPTDLDALLASLAIPGGPVAAPAAGEAPAPSDAGDAFESALPASAAVASPASAPAQTAAMPAAVNAALPEQGETAADGTTVNGQGHAAGQAQASLRSDATTQVHTGSAGLDQPSDVPARGTAGRVPEPQPVTDFHARLAALLNLDSGPATPGGGGGSFLNIAGPVSPSPGGNVHAVSVGNPLDALPALQPMRDQDAWSQGLADRLLLMTDKGLQSATLRLEPEHLGPMQIRIQVGSDGATQVLFSAHHSETRDALENAIPRLRDLFAEQGLNLMQANVDSGRSAFSQRDFTAPLQTWRQWGDDDTAGTPNPAVWQVIRNPAHRVDVFV